MRRRCAIDPAVLARLEALCPLAPLHQPHNLAGIRAVAAVQPDLPQVACFDTAFHRGHPELADWFALPRRFYDEGVRRYGFHGLSYEYIASVLPEVAPEIAKGRVVVAHLGSGASMCALKDGRSLDSTMGFTALDGLPMGTRCGALDPGVLLYLQRAHGMDADAIEHLLYHDCGLKGVSGISNDMRALLASDDPRAAHAIDLFVWRIGRELGALAASAGGLDGLVFTAGIGERSAEIRARVCGRAGWLGIELDDGANRAGGPRISRAASRVAVYAIPTDEEQMIARHTLAVLRAGGRALKETVHARDVRSEPPPPRRQEGPRDRHRQRELDRLRLRPGVPLVRRRARDHLSERQGAALRRAARAGARGADPDAPRRRDSGARWRRCSRRSSERWGRLDFALHSIAFAPRADLHGRVVDCSREGFLQAMDVSCHSFIRMARLAEPLMTHGGALFTMSYFGAERVVENYNLMGPVKAALEASARYLAAELGPKGIRVHAISPGPLKTRAASGIAQFDELLDKAAARAPARRLVTIEDVGFAVAGTRDRRRQADHRRYHLHRRRLPHHGLKPRQRSDWRTTT